MVESEEKLKILLMKVKEESQKVGLKLNIQMRWMKLEPIIQSEVNQKEKHQSDQISCSVVSDSL